MTIGKFVELRINSSASKNKSSKQENIYVEKSRVTLTHLMKQKRNLKDVTNPSENNFQNTSPQQSYTMKLGDALRITFLN